VSVQPSRLALVVALIAGLVALPPTLAAPDWPLRVAQANLGPAALSCSPETPAVALGETVIVRAWASPAAGRSLRYAWAATAGQIEGHGSAARWSLADLRPGTYAATVTVGDGGSAPVECIVRVIVRRDARPRDPSRETGLALLSRGRAEEAGYGLYSYLLLGSPPGEASRERYLKAIGAYWALAPDIASLEQYVQRRELNVAYVPVTSAPAGAVSAEWMIEQYDYARARSLLRVLPGVRRDGPYIVSVLRPLGGTGEVARLPGPYLFQDLSSVPPHLVASWVREFLNQAAQERFWEERTGEQLALRLRLTLGILGQGLPEVRQALDSWIAWLR